MEMSGMRHEIPVCKHRMQPKRTIYPVSSKSNGEVDTPMSGACPQQ